MAQDRDQFSATPKMQAAEKVFALHKYKYFLW